MFAFVSDKMRVFGPRPLPAITFTPFTLVTDAILFLLDSLMAS